MTRWAVVLGAVACAFPAVAVAQAPCGEEVRTSAAATVHVGPPTFSTGRGWTLAPFKATLPANSTVHVCQRVTVGFVGSKQEWARIQFKVERNLDEGWIAARALTGHKIEAEARGFRLPSPLVSVAYAQDLGGGDVPPPSTMPFLVMVFVSMLLGMAVKGLFDHLGEGIAQLKKTYLADTLKAFLVSPIVFMGFATGGDFQFTSDLALFVFLCMAFQNGFFWQTILAKAGPTAARLPAPSPAGGPG
jgi:hypothetical protein